jgi:radical SAM protein with 4Fe4S-binding SPASM domain
MNKEMMLFFNVGKPENLIQQLSFILDTCCREEYSSFVIRFTLDHKGIDRSTIKSVINIEKEHQEKHHFLVRNIIECDIECLTKMDIRYLSQKGFLICLNIGVFKKIGTHYKTMNLIKRYKSSVEILLSCPANSDVSKFLVEVGKCPLPIRIKAIEGSYEDLILLFDKWILSDNNANLLNLTDLLKAIMMKERIGCEYNSCMGRVLSIDTTGRMYWCKHNSKETILSGTHEIIYESCALGDLLGQGMFELYLDAHLQKREYCMSTCERYDICQGGCPLHCVFETNQNERCFERIHFDAFEHMSGEIKKILKAGDLSSFNNHARAIVLDAIAYAPFSDIFSEF